MLFSSLAVLASCKEEDIDRPEETTQPVDGVINEDVRDVEKLVYQGTHIFTATDTDKSLVSNGETDYKIVIPYGDDKVSTAQGEFSAFFAEATGIRLEVVTDDGMTHNADNKYISIGNTTLLQSAGIEIDEEKLGRDGARIVTKDNTVYIFGATEYGTTYAVYDFLQIYFGLEFYFADYYQINHNVKDLPLKNFDVTDIPDLTFRSLGYRGIITGINRYRFRMPIEYGQRIFPVHRVMGDKSSSWGQVHNSTCWLPQEEFQGAHPKWYGNSGVDLCYTAHGDEAELDAMIEQCVLKALDTLKMYNKISYPMYDVITLTMQDSQDPCTCSACEAEKEKYGSYAGAAIKFMNRLRARIDEEMHTLPEDCQREDLILSFFAYFYFEQAPTRNLEEIKLADGVQVCFAMNASFDYQSSIYAEVNDSARENFQRWMYLGTNPLLWTYSTKFTSYLFPCDTFNFYNQDAYSFFAYYTPETFFNQSQGGQKGTTTAWHNLKSFLDYKLTWNSSLDAGELTKDYMDAMFGPASETMYQLYNEMRLQAGIVKGQYASITILGNETEVEKPEFWPYPVVKNWLALCDKAYGEIEKLKETNPEAYAAYKSHIDAEWVSPAYMTLYFYSEYLDSNDLADLKATFKEVVTRLGMTHIREHNGDFSKFLADL